MDGDQLTAGIAGNYQIGKNVKIHFYITHGSRKKLHRDLESILI